MKYFSNLHLHTRITSTNSTRRGSQFVADLILI